MARVCSVPVGGGIVKNTIFVPAAQSRIDDNMRRIHPQHVTGKMCTPAPRPSCSVQSLSVTHCYAPFIRLSACSAPLRSQPQLLVRYLACAVALRSTLAFKFISVTSQLFCNNKLIILFRSVNWPDQQ